MREPTEKEMVDGIAQGIKDYLKFEQNTARLSDKPSSILEHGVSNGIRDFLSEMSAGKYGDGRPLRIFGMSIQWAIDKFLGRNKHQIIEAIATSAPQPNDALLMALEWALPLAWDAITNGREALSYSDANKQIDTNRYEKARAAIAEAEARSKIE